MKNEEKSKQIKQLIALGIVLLIVIVIAIITNKSSKNSEYISKIYPETIYNNLNNVVENMQNVVFSDNTDIYSDSSVQNLVENKEKTEAIDILDNKENTILNLETAEEYIPEVIKGESGTIPTIEIEEMDLIDVEEEH